MHFAEKVKALRAERGLKQSELAERAALGMSKLQRLEQASQTPKGSDALALARALGVSADYLLDDALPFPPPEEHLSEKVALIRRLEGLVGVLRAQGPAQRVPEPRKRPDVVRLPVFKLGAGFDVAFDAVGMPVGHALRDAYLDELGEGRFFAAELYGSSMRGPGDAGFALGEVLIFRVIDPGEVASGDYVYVRTKEQGLFRQAFVENGALRLRALNPADPEVRIEAKGIGHVCRLVRRIKEY